MNFVLNDRDDVNVWVNEVRRVQRRRHCCWPSRQSQSCRRREACSCCDAEHARVVAVSRYSNGGHMQRCRVPIV